MHRKGKHLFKKKCASRTEECVFRKEEIVSRKREDCLGRRRVCPGRRRNSRKETSLPAHPHGGTLRLAKRLRPLRLTRLAHSAADGGGLGIGPV